MCRARKQGPKSVSCIGCPQSGARVGDFVSSIFLTVCYLRSTPTFSLLIITLKNIINPTLNKINIPKNSMKMSNEMTYSISFYLEMKNIILYRSWFI
jgi:hypothetical protein